MLFEKGAKVLKTYKHQKNVKIFKNFSKKVLTFRLSLAII